jgi:cobalt-zinc-cadmium efflux system outer membrane protein
VIEAARARSLAVAAAEAELGIANAQGAAARVSSFGNPYSEIQIDRGFTQPNPGDRTGVVQAMTFNYLPVDIAGQRGKRVAEAEHLVTWRKLGIVDARAIATANAVSAWGGVVIASARIGDAHEGESAAREEAKYYSGRFAAKDATEYEKSMAEAEVTRWVQAVAEATLQSTAARARLSQVTGIARVDAPSAGTPLAPPRLRTTWTDEHIASIVDRTPIIERLHGERRYWDASLERWQRERFPAVTFEVIAGRGAGSELRLGAGAVITFPVTRRFQGEIAHAEFSRAHVTRHLDLYRNLIVARLRAARDALAVIDAALAELDASGIPALERAASAAKDGVKAGKIDITRALLARRDLALARARRLDLVDAAWRAYADLAAIGGDRP